MTAADDAASSPLTDPGRVKASLLPLQGEKNGRVTSDPAQRVADRRAAQGTIDETVFSPDEGQGLTGREHQSDPHQRTTDWFERYLTPTGAGITTAASR